MFIVICFCSDISSVEESIAPFKSDVSYNEKLALAVLDGEFKGMASNARNIQWLMTLMIFSQSDENFEVK